MKEDNEGFLYPQVEASTCIDCGLCEIVCPIINHGEQRQPIHAYAAKNKNEEIRLKSSSGGIFTLIAEQIINDDGVVFGACFDEYWNVVHGFTETVEGLEKFRGSKYVQSRIGDSYKEAEHFLKEGRYVLFSGTPCQIAGLKRFLRKEYENLLTVDIICHGVPSPKVWRKYLLEKMGANLIKNISFRDKSLGWKNYSLKIHSACGEDVFETLHENIYLQGFLKNLYLRPSCYNCKFKCGQSGSDISLGDYWGVENISPLFFDDKGVSLVLVYTSKGEHYFSLDVVETEEANLDLAKHYNGGLCYQVTAHRKRMQFFKKLNNTQDVKELINKILTPSPYERLRFVLRSQLRKIIK